MADDAVSGGSPTPAQGTPQNPQLDFIQPSVSKVPTGVFSEDQYGMDILRYPSELSSTNTRDQIPSYVAFNIYVPSMSPYAQNSNSSVSSVQSQSQLNSDYQSSTFGKTTAPGQIDTTGAVTVGAINKFSGGSVLGSFIAGFSAAFVSSFANQTVSLRPAIKRIGTCIQLYMPDTVMSSMNHDYSTVNATNAIGNLRWATMVGHSITDAAKRLAADTHLGDILHPSKWGDMGRGVFRSLAASVNDNLASKELAGKAFESTGIVGEGFTDLMLRSAGVAVNPQVELIYRGTKNRSFIFEFRFTPRSKQESDVIYQIIQAFKKYSSPGIASGQFGRYFIVPAQFDITFYFGNTVNPYLGKISTCVLESLDVNYVGQGQWASFTDGSPVEIVLMLRFLEAEIIYDDLVQRGF